MQAWLPTGHTNPDRVSSSPQVPHTSCAAPCLGRAPQEAHLLASHPTGGFNFLSQKDSKAGLPACLF